MIQHPTLLSDLAMIKHQERLKEAEQERLYRRIKGDQPTLFQKITQLLKGIGQGLKPQTRLQNKAVPAFGKK